MDDHTAGSGDGAGGQNPAYRPAHSSPTLAPGLHGPNPYARPISSVRSSSKLTNNALSCPRQPSTGWNALARPTSVSATQAERDSPQTLRHSSSRHPLSPSFRRPTSQWRRFWRTTWVSRLPDLYSTGHYLVSPPSGAGTNRRPRPGSPTGELGVPRSEGALDFLSQGLAVYYPTSLKPAG